MNINAVQNQMINHQGFNKVQKSKEDLPSVPDPVQAVPKAPEIENSAEGQKGVLRLLQEGHFNGVADIRLRINFHDEISAMESEQLKSAADGEVDRFINTVTDFLKSQEQTDEDLTPVVDAFLADAENAKAKFLTEGNLSIDALINDLKAAIENLIAGLNGLIPETAVEELAPLLTEEIVETVIDTVKEEEPVAFVADETPVAEVPLEEMPEETVVTDGPDVNAPPLKAEEDVAAQIALLIEELTPLFDAAASGLKDALSHTSALPELSEPTGNGVAYEKFLNIYNGLYGLGADEQPDSSFKIEA
jgi:hypothetical protein